MISELILHIGDTKTGSTSVQKVLAGRKYSIEGQTLAYVGNRNHNQLARSFVNTRYFGRRAEILDRHARVYQKSSADFGVISAEHLQFVDPEVLEEALRTHMPQMMDRLRVIAYVRPHHARLLSSYSQQTKAGLFKGTLKQYYKRLSAGTQLDYAPRFEKWHRVFGDRFMLRPYVRPLLYQQDTVSDFFRSILGHEQFTIDEQQAANPSMTVAQLAVLRRIHGRMREQEAFSTAQNSPKFKAGRGTLGHLMAAYMNDHGLGKSSEKLQISSDLGGKLRRRFRADAQKMDAMFFASGAAGETPLTAALEGAAAGAKTIPPQSLEAESHFDSETLQAVDAFSDILSLLLTKNPEGFQDLAHRMRRTFP